jgi:hypothetical protein
VTVEKNTAALSDRVEELEGTVEELEEALGDARATVTHLLSTEEPYRVLVSALITYLSWQDSPPTGMSAQDVERLGKMFRGQLDDALREVR